MQYWCRAEAQQGACTMPTALKPDSVRQLIISSLCDSQGMRGNVASCWWTTASPSPARTEPLASAAWPGPGATVPKVDIPQLLSGFYSSCSSSFIMQRFITIMSRNTQKRLCKIDKSTMEKSTMSQWNKKGEKQKQTSDSQQQEHGWVSESVNYSTLQ